MCGILLNYEATTEFDEHEFSKALNTMSHRGPDAQKFIKTQDLIMGHVRLSILDLSSNSDQPFSYDNYLTVYNGEIFNYLELRKELETLGHQFNTKSDTEVVIHAFKEWGQDCFSRFNGMWAICIYDQITSEITISRDRFGMKPLFLYNKSGSLIISSEVEPIAIMKDDLTRNYDEILAFLREGTHETSGATFFREITEVQPASVMVYKNGARVSNRLYWEYPKSSKRKTNNSTLEEFDMLLKDAVEIRMRSDVPIATLISGGVDSTIISALAQKAHFGARLAKGFCYGSEDAKDEQYYATEVAERLNLQLTIKKQSELDDDYLQRLQSLVTRLGKGHSSPAIVTISHLYEEVSNHGIKVALDGQGADELLGGYKNYYLTLLPYYLKKFDLKNFLQTLNDQKNFGFFLSVILWLRVVLPEKAKKLGRRIYGYERYLISTKKSTCQNYGWLKSKIDHSDSFNNYLIQQHKIGLTNLLYYGDIIAMKHSVENRSPFMDHRLVDYAFETDGYLKVNGGTDKYVLRRGEIYERFRDLLERRKIGFASPISLTIKKKMMSQLADSEILEFPIISQNLKLDMQTGKFEASKWERFLFRLYQVHLWNQVYFMKGV